VYQGQLNDIKVTVVTNGKSSKFGVDNVGTIPATLAAYIAITTIQPDLVINAGTAGGFKRKTANIGDVFIGTKFKNHDRRIPIPGFDKYGVGDYDGLSCKNLAKDLGFKTGTVTTSNSLDHNADDDKIMLENDASVKDMEAAAIAWVAEETKTPFFALKVVTDIVDGDRPTQEEFLENLGAAAKSLQLALPKMINYIKGKPLSQL
jgi:5'-methylthioadenosine nucleosidase